MTAIVWEASGMGCFYAIRRGGHRACVPELPYQEQRENIYIPDMTVDATNCVH
jgi:hypothetical protein